MKMYVHVKKKKKLPFKCGKYCILANNNVYKSGKQREKAVKKCTYYIETQYQSPKEKIEITKTCCWDEENIPYRQSITQLFIKFILIICTFLYNVLRF